MKCRNCGYQNKEDAVFCSGCGKKIIRLSEVEEDIKIYDKNKKLDPGSTRIINLNKIEEEDSFKDYDYSEEENISYLDNIRVKEIKYVSDEKEREFYEEYDYRDEEDYPGEEKPRVIKANRKKRYTDGDIRVNRREGHVVRRYSSDDSDDIIIDRDLEENLKSEKTLRRKGRKRIFRSIFLIILTLIITFSSYQVVSTVIDDKKSKSELGAIEKITFKKETYKKDYDKALKQYIRKSEEQYVNYEKTMRAYSRLKLKKKAENYVINRYLESILNRFMGLAPYDKIDNTSLSMNKLLEKLGAFPRGYQEIYNSLRTVNNTSAGIKKLIQAPLNSSTEKQIEALLKIYKNHLESLKSLNFE